MMINFIIWSIGTRISKLAVTELDIEGLNNLRDRYGDWMMVGIHFWEEDAHISIWNINIFFMSVVAIAIVYNLHV